MSPRRIPSRLVNSTDALWAKAHVASGTPTAFTLDESENVASTVLAAADEFMLSKENLQAVTIALAKAAAKGIARGTEPLVWLGKDDGMVNINASGIVRLVAAALLDPTGANQANELTDTPANAEFAAGLREWADGEYTATHQAGGNHA